MKLHNIAALGLVIALAGACDNNKKPSAEGATNNTNASTNSSTANQGGAKEESASATDLPIEATGPVAKVNGEPITADEFNAEVARLKKMMGARMPPGMLVNMKGQIVDQLVAKKLVEGAVKDANVTVADEEVDEEFQKFADQLSKASPGGLDAYLQQAGRTKAEMKEDVKSSLELKKLMAKDHDIEIPPAEIKKYYKEHKEEFDQAERLQASHILLKLDQNATAEKVAEVEKRAAGLAKQAKADGADFAKLAQDNSEGPTASRGGNLGYFERGKMVKEFDEVAWKLKPGDVSDPVRTQFGFHVIKVLDHAEAKSLSFDEAKDLIEAKLQGPKLKEAMKTTIEGLKASAKIERLDQNIKANVAPPKAPPNMFGGGGGGHPPVTMPPGAKGQGGGGGGAKGGTKAPKLKLDKLK